MCKVEKSLKQLKEDLDETVLITVVVKRSDLETLTKGYEELKKAYEELKKSL